MKITHAKALPSLSRTREPDREVITVAALQFAWKENPAEHQGQIENAVKASKKEGAQIVFLPELTLSRYPADTLPNGTPNHIAENLENGSTAKFLKRLAIENSIVVHGSLYEYQDFSDGRGLNTAVMFDTAGNLIAKSPKLHIPVTVCFFEYHYFQH